MNDTTHKYTDRRPLPPRRISAFVRGLQRIGYQVDQGAASDFGLSGWVRLYNVSQGEPVRDYTGESKPRIYSVGTRGVQIEWRTHDRNGQIEETASYRAWTVAAA